MSKDEGSTSLKYSVSKNSTYHEVWAYLQSFRPTGAEIRQWLDGTHTEQHPPDGDRDWRLLTYCWTRTTQKKEGGFHQEMHRDGGRPAFVWVKNPAWSWLRVNGGSSSEPEALDTTQEVPAKGGYLEAAKFFDLDNKLRMGARPWLLRFSDEGDVREARFSSNGEESHRTDGPAGIKVVGNDYVELSYAVRGEVVETVKIWRES